ncbi:unnamed protein product, partial [Prorocentrum cordatum]
VLRRQRAEARAAALQRQLCRTWRCSAAAAGRGRRQLRRCAPPWRGPREALGGGASAEAALQARVAELEAELAWKGEELEAARARRERIVPRCSQ